MFTYGEEEDTYTCRIQWLYSTNVLGKMTFEILGGGGLSSSTLRVAGRFPSTEDAAKAHRFSKVFYLVTLF